MPKPTSPEIKSRAESLFTQAADAQHEFWNALAALEQELGMEIAGTTDLHNTRLDSLLIH